MAFANESRRVTRCTAIGVLFCAAAFSAFAATPDEYKHKIDSAKKHVEELLETVADSELGERDKQRENDLVAQTRKEVPASEKVEWPSGSVETSNQWLSDKLGEFQNEPDSTKRAVILTAVSERLRAISDSIDDLDKAAAAQRTKDQDKQKLAEILRRQEYQKPKVEEESLFQKWWREFWDWLDRVYPNPVQAPAPASDFRTLQFGLQILIYLVVIGFVGFLIYKFAPSLMGRFGGKIKKTKQENC